MQEKNHSKKIISLTKEDFDTPIQKFEVTIGIPKVVENKISVKDYINSIDKELEIGDFSRLSLT